MKCRFEDNFLCRIALRFVEARGGLGLAEDIGDAVVTNAIPRTEVAVSVVVESTPADATSILRIRSKLVVNSSMADRVLGQTLDLVDRLGWIGVPNKLGV